MGPKDTKLSLVHGESAGSPPAQVDLPPVELRLQLLGYKAREVALMREANGVGQADIYAAARKQVRDRAAPALQTTVEPPIQVKPETLL